LNFLTGSDPDKNKIGIAIKFCKCYIIKRSPSNFSNKTQLKNYFFKLGRTRFNAFNFGPDPVWPETLLHCSREQWRVTPYSSRELWSCTLHYSLMWTVKSATLHLTKTQQEAWKNCLRKTCGETSDFYGSHDQNTAAEDNQTLCYWIWQKTQKLTQSQTL